jgi:S-adenosylmethionine synthetase
LLDGTRRPLRPEEVHDPMKERSYLFTSESVTEGHPDKVCDQISDAILDALLRMDPDSRVAVETLTTTGLIVVAGEVTTKGYIDVQAVVRGALRGIGYDRPEYGFNADDCSVLVSLHEQSPCISRGVTEGQGDCKEQGAGDQGLMFGYATNETPGLMPLPIWLAHRLTERLSQVRKSGALDWMRPDGKSQVTVEYVDGRPARVDSVIVSVHHSPDVSNGELRKDVMEHVVMPVMGQWVDDNTKYYINPTGSFVKGGPPADSGLTGRKIIVDTYGGQGRHGGGAFSGKDPSKVDRSAAYMARHIAKNIVAAGLAEKCELQVAYAIGVAQPVSLMVNTFGTSRVPEERIEAAVLKLFDLRPKEIIRYLDLKRPIYQKTAAYGHFGREDPEFTWERTNRAQELRMECGLERELKSAEAQGIPVAAVPAAKEPTKREGGIEVEELESF